MNTLRAGLVSVSAAGLVLLGAAGLGHALSERAQVVSRELPPWTGLTLPPGVYREALPVRGRQVFLESCAHCHGADARGDEGPDLHDLQVSDRRIATVVRRGIPHEMPSFVRKYQAPDIAAVIAYLRTLR